MVLQPPGKKLRPRTIVSPYHRLPSRDHRCCPFRDGLTKRQDDVFRGHTAINQFAVPLDLRVVFQELHYLAADSEVDQTCVDKPPFFPTRANDLVMSVFRVGDGFDSGPITGVPVGSVLPDQFLDRIATVVYSIPWTISTRYGS